MNFQQAIAAQPYAPNQEAASGFLPTVFRAVGHIMYVLGAYAASREEPPTYALSDEEVHRELHDAATHLSRTVATTETAPLSDHAKDRVRLWVLSVSLADDEWLEWSPEQCTTNLKALADRTAALGALLDFELAGLRGSNPGFSL